MKKKKRKYRIGIIVNIALIVIVSLGVGYSVGNYLRQQERNTPNEFVEKASSMVPTSQGLPKAPAPDASEEEKAAFSRTINEKAQETTRIEINERCSLSPSIARIAEGSPLTFVNKDAVEHRIRTAMEELIISPESEEILTAQFEYGLGIYGIVCDAAEKGFLEIVPK